MRGDIMDMPSHLNRRRWRDFLRCGLWAVWLAWVACFIATLLIIFYDVESVMSTGPIILVLGIIAAVRGGTLGYLPTLVLGIADCAVCVLFFGLVQVLSWAPRDAKLPFALMGAIFTITTFFVALWATRRVPQTRDPWECANCGYLLYGLRDPRCPECGTPFDPALLGTGGRDQAKPPGNRST